MSGFKARVEGSTHRAPKLVASLAGLRCTTCHVTVGNLWGTVPNLLLQYITNFQQHIRRRTGLLRLTCRSCSNTTGWRVLCSSWQRAVQAGSQHTHQSLEFAKLLWHKASRQQICLGGRRCCQQAVSVCVDQDCKDLTCQRVYGS